MVVFVIIIAIIAIIIVVKVSSKRNKEKLSGYYKSAAEHERNGNYDQAINDYNKALQLDSDPNYTRYKERGDLYRKTGNYDQAIADYNQAISSAKNYIEKQDNQYEKARKAAAELGKDGWGNFYYDRSKENRSITEYKRNIAECLSLRGEMNDKNGNKTQAMADYDEAIKSFKNLGTDEDLISCADVNIKKGNKEQALEIYNKLIWEFNKDFKEDTTDFLKLYSLCQICVKAGDYDKAIANLETLLKFNQDNVQDYDDVKVLKDTQAKAREELDAVKKMTAASS